MEKPAASDSVLLSLEFPAVLELLILQTQTPYGKEAARLLKPTPDPEEARALQAVTREMVLYRQSRGALSLPLPLDARPTLDRLTIGGSILTGKEINALLEHVRVGQAVRGLLSRSEHPRLHQTARQLPDLANLLRFLEGKITATGEVEDRCSNELLLVRRQVAALTTRLETALRTITSRPEVARALQDTFVALRNNRHVIPVRLDSQGCVEGIVHALSSSGATVYVEPLSTIPLNNDLVRLREQEEVEVRRVLLDFSDLLRGRLPDLRLLIQGLCEVDLISAKAALAEAMGGVDPELTDGSGQGNDAHLLLSEARHPVLERSLGAGGGSPLIPLNLTLDSRHQVLVISGPNTGGKTVALKTTGLLALMAQTGLHVPAAAARLPAFRKILIDIGDHQSIPENLSTFSARLANISAMARCLETPALVLLDEVGTGTDPEEGASLGAAIIEFFRTRGALVLATTHHQTLKAYAASAPCVANASMEFDESSRRPLFRLRSGVPGRSGGLDIAECLGLPEEIVRVARSFLPRQREILDGYVRSLQTLQEAMDRERRSLAQQTQEARDREKEREETTRRLALDRETRFAQSLEEIAIQVQERWNLYLREVSDREEKSRLRREFERRERKLLEEARSSLPEDLLMPARKERGAVPTSLSPGERVRIAGLRVEGVVERLDGDRVTLRVGTKRLRVTRSDLDAVTDSAKAGATPPIRVQLTRHPDTIIQREINLIGKRVEEALALLDKYLDEVYLAAATPVRVVHGVGTGKLRTAIRSFLETHPHVEGFSEAGDERGGRGATVVRIRV